MYPEIRSDSIRNEILKSLYLLKFEPAIGNETPVMSFPDFDGLSSFPLPPILSMVDLRGFRFVVVSVRKLIF